MMISPPRRRHAPPRAFEGKATARAAADDAASLGVPGMRAARALSTVHGGMRWMP